MSVDVDVESCCVLLRCAVSCFEVGFLVFTSRDSVDVEIVTLTSTFQFAEPPNWALRPQLDETPSETVTQHVTHHVSHTT